MHLKYDDRKDGSLADHITKFESYWLNLAQAAHAGHSIKVSLAEGPPAINIAENPAYLNIEYQRPSHSHSHSSQFTVTVTNSPSPCHNPVTLRLIPCHVFKLPVLKDSEKTLQTPINLLRLKVTSFKEAEISPPITLNSRDMLWR